MAESFGSSPTNNSLSTSSNSSISSSFPTLSPGSIYANSTLSPSGTTQTQSATSTASSTPTDRNGPWRTPISSLPPNTQPLPTYHPPSIGRPPRSGLPTTSYISGPFLPNSNPPTGDFKPQITVPPPHPLRVNYEYDVQAGRWKTICVKVLPLFNGEGLKMPIEDLNELVRLYLAERSPEALCEDIRDPLSCGMATLNSRLSGVPDEKLVSRLVEVWSFYFGTVVPYFEGVFLPLTILTSGSDEFSVRRLVLMAFRDDVILPMGNRVEDAFNKLFHDFDSGIPVTDTAARMLQMTYILSSILSDDEKQWEMDRILAALKNNWKLFMKKRDRRGFIGVSPSIIRTDDTTESSPAESLNTPTFPTNTVVPDVMVGGATNTESPTP